MEPTWHEKEIRSSALLYENTYRQALTLGCVNTTSEMELYQFKWLESADFIGKIPHRWKHMVGHDSPNPDVHCCTTL